MRLGSRVTQGGRVSLLPCILHSSFLHVREGAPRGRFLYLEGRETLRGRDKFCLHKPM